MKKKIKQDYCANMTCKDVGDGRSVYYNEQQETSL